MEKIFVILLIFAFVLTTTGGEITFRDFNPEDVEVEKINNW